MRLSKATMEKSLAVAKQQRFLWSLPHIARRICIGNFKVAALPLSPSPEYMHGVRRASHLDLALWPRPLTFSRRAAGCNSRGIRVSLLQREGSLYDAQLHAAIWNPSVPKTALSSVDLLSPPPLRVLRASPAVDAAAAAITSPLMARGFCEGRPYQWSGCFVSDPLRFGDFPTGCLPAGTCFFDEFLRVSFVRLGLDEATIRPWLSDRNYLLATDEAELAIGIRCVYREERGCGVESSLRYQCSL